MPVCKGGACPDRHKPLADRPEKNNRPKSKRQRPRLTTSTDSLPSIKANLNEEIYLDFDFDDDEPEDTELAEIISENSLSRQAIKGKLTVAQICEVDEDTGGPSASETPREPTIGDHTSKTSW